MSEQDKSERYHKGLQQMRKQLGSKADEYVKTIEDFSEIFGRVNVEFPFGDLYTREDVLDLRTREIATVAALTVQGFSLPQLRVHIVAALNSGATREEVVEIITQMIAYAGFPAATNALMTAKSVFEELDNE